MIIGVTHWFFAAGIAVAIHLAGMLWLSIPEPSARMPEREAVSDDLVVTLGRRARATAELVEAAESMMDESVPTVAEAAPDAADASPPVAEPDVAVETIPEAAEPTAPEPEPQALDLASVDTAEPVAADTAQAQPADPVSPEPLEAEAAQTQSADAVAPEPPEADASQAQSADAVAPQPPETTSQQLAEVDEVEPPRLVDADPEAPQPPQSANPEPGESVGVDTVDGAAQAPSSAVEVAPEDTAPTRFADDAPVPEVAATSDAASDVGASVADAGVETAGAASPEVDAAAVSAEPGLAPALEDVATVRPEEAGATGESEAVDPQSADDVAGVEVATARQPETQVEMTESPETVSEARPETIDLEELQDDSGSSGVVASYAGTLKGWLTENMHYPRAARLDGQEGKVVVRFVIDREGRVQSVVLESESGYPLLDREAQEMIERGDPFPKIPEEMSAEQLEVRVPVNFNIREETLTKEIPPIYLE